MSEPFPPTASWRHHAQTVRDSSSSYKRDYVIVTKNFLNPKGHQNVIGASKVTAILLKKGILPIGGASAGEGLLLQPAQQVCFNLSLHQKTKKKRRNDHNKKRKSLERVNTKVQELFIIMYTKACQECKQKSFKNSQAFFCCHFMYTFRIFSQNWRSKIFLWWEIDLKTGPIL